MTEDEAAAKLLLECRNDPYRFVLSAYPWGEPGTTLEDKTGPRTWQAEELQAITEHLNGPNCFEPFRVSIASGHGIGKSALIAWLAHWGICTMTDAKGVITANTEAQLRTKTWPELRKWYALLAVRDWFRVDNTVFRSNDKEHELTWRADAIPWSENNPEAFAGTHNEGKRIVGLWDEGSAIVDKIWEVFEGALTDELTQILWVVFGNPTRPQGRFYQTHHLHRHRWRHKQIDSRNVEGTNKSQLKEWIQDYGEDSDFCRVRVKGQFPRSGSNQLISTEDVTEAQQRDGEVAPRFQDPLIFGIDCARFGDDQSVLFTRKGVAGGIHGVFKWRGLDTTQLVDAIVPKIIELQPHHIFIDEGYIGAAVIDILRNTRHFDVTGVNFGSRKVEDPLRFHNKRAEMWSTMGDWLQGGGSIPWDDTDLANDLINQTYLYREADNTMLLTPKDAMKRDGLPSPDSGDALALTFAYKVNPVTEPRKNTVKASDVAEAEYSEGWL